MFMFFLTHMLASEPLRLLTSEPANQIKSIRESPRSFAGSYKILPPERFFHGRFSRFSPQALTRCICEGSHVIHRLQVGRPFHQCCCELTRLATLAISFTASRPKARNRKNEALSSAECCRYLLKLATPNAFWICDDLCLSF